jgi:diguanylate cyclase (GGDEF)-like protein
MQHPRFIKDLAIGGGFFAVYLLAGKMSLRLASLHPSASPVWPPTGIALAALLVLGVRFWPAVLAGAFVVNLTTAGTAATSLGIAAGNALEAVCGCWLVNRFAGGSAAFDTPRNIFRFAALAGLLSTAISATLGVTSLSLAGYAPWRQYASIWFTWWLGDATGAMVVAPLLVLWAVRPRLEWTYAQAAEVAALLLSLAATAQFTFGGSFQLLSGNEPHTYLCAPFLVWAAFRFGQRKTATAVFVLAAIAVAGTVRGTGPFASGSLNTSLLHLHLFLAVTSVLTLAFAAEVAERRRQEERVRHLAVSDALTGLANYRRLVEGLDAEVKRYGRTGRRFAVLLLDLDGLKKINDGHGHVVGSRALCRVADVLRGHCREVDTPARYGGDEFAVVLPETEREDALQVAQRISARLAADQEPPRLSVSIGVAVYPEDGASIEQLLSSADHALYRQKQ